MVCILMLMMFLFVTKKKTKKQENWKCPEVTQPPVNYTRPSVNTFHGTLQWEIGVKYFFMTTHPCLVAIYNLHRDLRIQGRTF